MNTTPRTSVSESPKKGGIVKIWTGITAGVLLLAAIVTILFYFNITPCEYDDSFCPPPMPTPTPLPTSTATPPPPSPTLVQHNFSQPGSTTPSAVSFKQSVTPGDLVVVAITQDITMLTGVRDNHHDTYTSVKPALFANSQDMADYVELYYAKNVVGGSTTVTATFTAPPANSNYSGDSNVGIYEFSGLSKTSPLDSAASLMGGSQSGKTDQVTSVGGVPLGTSENNEICFAVGVDSGLNNSDDPKINTPAAVGQGYYQLDQQDDSVNYERFYTEWAPIPKAGSPGCNPNFTLQYESYWAIIGAAFKQ